MKLKRFDTSNAVTSARTGYPTITLMKNGSIGLNRHAMELLDLEPTKSHVVFHQDEESRKNWYLEVDAKNGFTVRGKKEGGTFASVTVCREIWKSFGMKEATIRLKINDKQKQLSGLKLWEIIDPDYEKAIESL
ncbi:MAG: hypothetical protein ACK5M7_20510 [Draconibacterium sp.]